jgi:hypothetical protein
MRCDFVEVDVQMVVKLVFEVFGSGEGEVLIQKRMNSTSSGTEVRTYRDKRKGN